MSKSKEQLREEFRTFHRSNPEVYRLLKRFALEAQRAGLKRLGIALLIERVRWESTVVIRSEDAYRINNNHRAFYARLLMRKVPELYGLFSTRRQKKNSGL